MKITWFNKYPEDMDEHSLYGIYKWFKDREAEGLTIELEVPDEECVILCDSISTKSFIIKHFEEIMEIIVESDSDEELTGGLDKLGIELPSVYWE